MAKKNTRQKLQLDTPRIRFKLNLIDIKIK